MHILVLVFPGDSASDYHLHFLVLHAGPGGRSKSGKGTFERNSYI